MFESLDRILDHFLKLGVSGNDCVVYKDGECIYRRQRGFSDAEQQIPMNGKEVYNLYSNSKFITCVAAMQLVEKGVLSLDDPLYDYIPDFKKMRVLCPEGGTVEAKNPIKISDLFKMTAGFSYCLDSPSLAMAQRVTDGKMPTVEAMRFLANEPLLFEPSTRWEYSLCHDVLAAVIEVASEKRLSLYIKENIFDPLGMNDSTYNLPDDRLDTVCAQYRRNEMGERYNCGPRIIQYKLGSEYESGGAGCVSTVDDYIKFLEALRKGDSILSEASVKLMATDALTEIDHAGYWFADKYGYGLGIRTPKNGSDRIDFGWDGAANAAGAIVLEHGITMYYGQHYLGMPDDYLKRDIIECVLKDLKLK